MKLLCAVWIGDERYGNERNDHKKRGLLVWPPLRLLEHQRSALHQVCRAPRQRREQRASPPRLWHRRNPLKRKSECAHCWRPIMDDDAEFITRLTGFGLSEKEAQLYLHLLKHGPKTPSPIAKTLK